MIAWQAHKQELQQQIAEKQATADALQAEHARLVGQHTMLARILDTQQSAVNLLQGQQQVASPLVPPATSNMVSWPNRKGTFAPAARAAMLQVLGRVMWGWCVVGGGGERGAAPAQPSNLGPNSKCTVGVTIWLASLK